MIAEIRGRIDLDLQKLESLPTLPTILRPLLHYMDQPVDNVQLEKLIELVSCDESLAAQCLRLANSPLYGRRYGINTLRGAVVALGVRSLRDLLLSCCLLRLVPREDCVIDPFPFWEHSFACALISRQFATRINYTDPEKAYLAGLLHDIGELINSILFPGDFRRASERAYAESIPLCEAELAELGFTHCDSGSILAEKWKLPEELRDVIAYHHDVEQAKQQVALVAIVSISDEMCPRREWSDNFDLAGEFGPLATPAWNILTKQYPYISETKLADIAIEMHQFATEIPQIVSSIFRS